MLPHNEEVDNVSNQETNEENYSNSEFVVSNNKDRLSKTVKRKHTVFVNLTKDISKDHFKSKHDKSKKHRTVSFSSIPDAGDEDAGHINENLESSEETMYPESSKTLKVITPKDDDVLSRESTSKRKRGEMEKDMPFETDAQQASLKAKNSLLSQESNSDSSKIASSQIETQENNAFEKIKDTSRLSKNEASSLIEGLKDLKNRIQPISRIDEDVDYSASDKILLNHFRSLDSDAPTGITLVWQNERKLIRFFCLHSQNMTEEETSNLNEIEKVFLTPPGLNSTKSDEPSKKIINSDSYSYNQICQFAEKIEELYDEPKKTFQKVGRNVKFHRGDYFIKRITRTQIKVIPCCMHKIVSLSNVQTLLETKAIDMKLLNPRPIVMAADVLNELKSIDKIETCDGFYFAGDSYSMNISRDMNKKYIKLCRLITPEFYDALGVYIVGYTKLLSSIQLEPKLTNLGKIFIHQIGEPQIKNHQLRKYLNTIHNYYLNDKITVSTGNTYDELIDVYNTLIHNVMADDDFSDNKISSLKNYLSSITDTLSIDKFDCVISPNVQLFEYKKSAKEVTKVQEYMNRKSLDYAKSIAAHRNKEIENMKIQIEKQNNFFQERINDFTAISKGYLLSESKKDILLDKVIYRQERFEDTVRDLKDTIRDQQSTMRDLNDSIKDLKDLIQELYKSKN